MLPVRIELPWPDASLFPNRANGQHWGKVRKARDAAKHIGYVMAKGKQASGRCLVMEIHPPDKRRRDLDGILSACKNTIDGMCAALGFDDSEINPVILIRKPPVKAGKIIFYFVEKYPLQ